MPPGPSSRDQAHVALTQKLGQLDEIVLAAYETIGCQRQMAGRGVAPGCNWHTVRQPFQSLQSDVKELTMSDAPFAALPSRDRVSLYSQGCRQFSLTHAQGCSACLQLRWGQ